MTPEIEEAYRQCRLIARGEARNFYYAFAALPGEKRNAICAVYAFMRRADDLSDDESVPLEQRRLKLGRWLGDWHGILNGQTSNEPILQALLDAHRRFSIPPQLLDQLVEGTATDFRPSRERDGALAEFATFKELYRYCYLVASVVGLVTIRIFGYSDPEAEKLAEETGVAFQLTNILRDVREDAERGRMYLPREDLDRFGVSPQEIATIGSPLRQPLTRNQRDVFSLLAERAEVYYRSADRLLPLVAADSRPALWVLVSIYRRLLRRIEERNFDVFTSRVSVPAYEKLAWMAAGIGKLMLSRVGGRIP